MLNSTYSFRLEGLPTPNGEISVRDLVDIGAALQLTATRIARQVGGLGGRGRSTSGIERISELRLSGISAGSTVLEIRLGDNGSLPLSTGDEQLVASRFEETFTSIATNGAPTWANSGVIAAIGRLASRVSASGATRLTASHGAGPTAIPWQVVDFSRVDLAVWSIREERTAELVTMTGRLDKVDLRVRRFRVRDDVGNDVTLDDVVDVDAAAQLIGQRVVASGIAEQEHGRVVRIIEPVLQREELPIEWFAQASNESPVGGIIARVGIPGVTHEEVDDFLAEIRG